MFSREDTIFIVEKWYETHSLAFIRRAFRKRDARYHGKNLPSRTSIERVVKHFQRSGTVADLRSTYLAQRERNFSPEKVRRVKKVYARRQKVSLRRASHSTNVTRYFVNVRYFSSDNTIPCTRANMCVVNLCANSSTRLQGIRHGRHVYHFIRADEMRKARIFQERMVLFPC